MTARSNTSLTFRIIFAIALVCAFTLLGVGSTQAVEGLCTVSYYDGTKLLGTSQVAAGSSAMAGPAKAGNTFAGWYSAPTGGIKITKITADGDLYARYTKNKYTCTFYDGTKLLKKANYNFDATLSQASGAAPNKTGKTFAGWYTAATGGTKVAKVPAKNIKLYARYTNTKYTVKYYDHNKVLIKNTTQTYNTQVMAGPKRSGYTFKGWYTASGTKVTKITVNRNLYAQYTKNKYTCTFYDGTKLLKKANYNFDATLSQASGAAANKTGKTFAGWYTAATGGSKVAKVPAKNIKLYARYSNIPYTVKYNYNYTGSPATLSKAQSYNSAVLAAPTRTGYTFKGWYTAASGGTKVDKIPAKSITLYAQWTVKSYTVKYYNQSGALLATKTEKYGAALAFPAKPATPSGKQWDNWYTSQTGSTVASKVTGNMNVYARFKDATYTVTYRGPDGSSETRTVTHGTAVIAGPTHPSGWTFLGWYTSSTGGSKVSTITSTITLWARYEQPQMYGVVYYDWTDYEDTYPDGVITGGATIFAGLGGIVPLGSPLVEGPAKPGYVFEGWYTSQIPIVHQGYVRCNGIAGGGCTFISYDGVAFDNHQDTEGHAGFTSFSCPINLGPNSIGPKTTVEGDVTLYAKYRLL